MPEGLPAKSDAQRLKDFFLILRQALLMVVHWIEDEYALEPSNKYRQYFVKYGLDRPN